MKKSKSFIIKAINHYFTFFIMIAFVITCCMLLFLSVFSRSLGITLSDENIGLAAKLTFLNVVVISFIFTVFDSIRRKLTVDIPVKRITEAAEKMIEGDFSVRIPKNIRYFSDDKFNEIIGCINKMAEELSGVETLRNDFVSNVSHEMKTPLTVIQNYGKLIISDGVTNEKRVEYGLAVIDASKRLSDLVTNILKLTKLENQKIFSQASNFDLGEHLADCFLQFESVWEEKNIEIETEIEEGVNVYADKELLGIVWNNLFSNAFKFTDFGGKVKLSLKTENEYALVKVCDNGCGISSEVGSHIFEKFYQGDSSRQTEGNGLGLALVKRVVDIVGGDISVESKIGQGSVFTVRIRRNSI